MSTISEIQNHPTNTQLKNRNELGFTNSHTEKQSRPSKKQSKFCYWIAAAFILMSICTPAAAESFIPVMGSDTLDYYVGYGEPEITASLRGNQELGKGETASLQIAVANKGLLEKVSYREYVIAANLSSYIESMGIYEPDPAPGGANYVQNGSVDVITVKNYSMYLKEASNMNQQNTLAQTEMMIEANRVNAETLNMKFVCDSPYIEIDNSGDYAYLESLNSGTYSVVSIPIKINPETPAGEYIVNMTVNYKYPSNAKMIKAGNGTDGFTTFLYSDSYVQEYTGVTEIIQIPIYISSGAVFETSDITETIRAGKTKTITVTYTNIGDETAYNTEAKLSLMHPLSSTRNKALLGDVAPGESVTVDYPITAHADAIEKVYGVNTDIRYYDEDDKLQIAPSVKLDIDMVNPFSLFTFKNALVGVILLVVLSLVYDYAKKKKKDGKEDESETSVKEI
ncbi:hypothetical protein MmiHf6_15120 [Methanimicrococcus hongohii]|uniref:S-layer protein n=1 Tax=Methanimicrococcus hongohii TaxID=3028295 RepID=A0AA96V361_9EURY|nr:hypothetical protein [Methanimicrococcus sp. Hf6]WNY24183.1 hypothetical protein MmiHf6_15120 [Methanimicrococcus sp. Hf6]